MQSRGKSLDLQIPRRGLRAFAAGLIGLCGAYQVGLGIYFIALRPPLLPEDLRFFGVGREALRMVLPRLEPWLHLVFTVLGGQMAAVGALVFAASIRLAFRGVSAGRELVPLGIAGALSVGLMSAMNFALGSDFRWLLLVPVGVLALGLILALSGHSGVSGAASTDDKHA